MGPTLDGLALLEGGAKIGFLLLGIIKAVLFEVRERGRFMRSQITRANSSSCLDRVAGSVYSRVSDIGSFPHLVSRA